MRNFKRIAVAKPPLAGKSFCIREEGLFLLEECPGIIWHLLCMRAGSVGATVYDAQLSPDGEEVRLSREIFALTPAVLGVWHLNAGFQFGLAIKVPKHGNHNPGDPGLFIPVWITRTDGTSKKGEQHSKTVEGTGHIRETLTDKNCVLYQAQVVQAGLGEARLFDGLGNEIWSAPKGVVGSFVLEHVFCRGGLRLAVDSPVSVRLTFTWFDVKEE